MADIGDAVRTPTKRPGSSSNITTPRSRQKSSQEQTAMEDDLPLPPQDVSSVEEPNLDAYFMPLPPSQAASIYSVYKATLSGQLSQLTQTDLPNADSLAAAITALPTAAAAVKALTSSARQIKSWIRSAAEVLGGLDAGDDVDWAGSGSKDGVMDVETAIQKFGKLVSTYITAVEDARKRPDVQSVPKAEMTTFLDTLEEVVSAWVKVREALQKVKTQNELAMEWEDIWNVTLGEIGQEIEALGTLVFELEEKRYTIGFNEEEHTASGVDIKELETIAEESPSNRGNRGARAVSIPWDSPLASPGLQGPSEDCGLLNLFARMQPLRASLDFLPMQLMTYEARAIETFPSACLELQSRRSTLEKKYKILEADAEILRRELGEDRWVVVFRTAARQAQKMCESIEKGIQKLYDTLSDEAKASNAGLLAKKISDYEAKRNNYGPAIQKVLSMIDKGVKDRVTVNGEILRIHEDTHQMWTELERRLSETDGFLDEAQSFRSQQLRDSISTIVSTDMSGITSNTETPASSLASSPAVGPADNASIPTTPDMSLPRSRNSSVRSLSSSRPSVPRRVASQPPSSSTRHYTTHLLPMSRLSTDSSCPAPRSTATPMPTIHSSRTVTPGTATASKPRWSVGSAIDRKLLETKSGFTPTAYARRLKESRPSVYSFRSTSGSAISSALPSPSPLGGSSLSSSRHSTGPVLARAASSLGFRSRRDSSPTPSFDAEGAADSTICDVPGGRPRSRLYRPSISGTGTSTPSSNRVPSLGSKVVENPRRTSMLPLPLLNTSPEPPALTVPGIQSTDPNLTSSDHHDDVLPSIEHDEILPLPPALSTKQRLPLRPASSLGRASLSFNNGPLVAHTRASLLRAGSAAPGAGSTKAKPKWK